MARVAWLGMNIALAAASLTGCDPATPPPASRPALTSRPASQPASSSAPATEPAASAPAAPAYIRPGAPLGPRGGKLTYRLVSPTRLEIETDNLAGITITRQESPLAKDRSVALSIDGQGIEWTPRSTTITLERSINGAWYVAPASQPAP